ncbi:TrmO family methyltransferase domain-containing protein [Alkaliphilus peptidifermentans]|uniref:UvrABC system protein A n=1 Tax=Alkaliphilus peptidifermentans DSM 18978 TaxID=1120976 RepID=A0A1G5G3B1_9FIRM|nr:TrmO family methyltransferase [Alkaliphilus peptidifermentans]SCY45829.1 excinuclease ABC, A subunit [Alkaliphilus peptidifermentans DSM 18978]
MKKIKCVAIGNYEVLKSKFDGTDSIIKMVINEEFRDALIKLDHFSHCLIFTKCEEGIICYGAVLKEINEKSGEMVVEGRALEGELVDIKPYFPCEERVHDSTEENIFDMIPFKGEHIGEYLFVNHRGLIQFYENEKLSGNKIKGTLEKIKTGDYIRVLWWFHRFDDKKYRSCCMCNPPYENSPKSGIFATRSPVRPNPLASTVVKVLHVDPHNHNIVVSGFDGFEHSIVLQIMPYSEVEVFDDAKVPLWLEHWTRFKVFQETMENSMPIDITTKEATNEEVIYLKELEGDDCFELNINQNEIIVENASINNLKDISVRIPKEKITVITGVSGSGKSSLAFDTIYHESQKQFIDLVASNPPIVNDSKDTKVGKITGLQPSIAIEQTQLGLNPRSTVGSVTRTSDFLRLLFATIGEGICPHCNIPVPENNVCSSCGTIFFESTPALFNYNHTEYMCPVCKGLGEEMQVDLDLIVNNPDISILDGASVWWGNLRKHREKPNANWMRGEILALAEDMKENLEVPFKDLSDEFKRQLFYGSAGREVSLSYENTNGRKGTITRPVEGVINTLNRLVRENNADKSMTHFERFIVKKKCSRCQGERLMDEGRLVRIGFTRYPEATKMNITRLKYWCHTTYDKLSITEKEKTKGIFIKLLTRLKRLEQVGLSYLCLDRSIPSLSGGEAQRLKIASQFGSGLTNILYVMDEPSKGLHPKDFQFLMGIIKDLKKLNNTVVMVEHKKEFIDMADFIVEIGPGAGQYGGELLRAEEVEGQIKDYIDDFPYQVQDKVIKGESKLSIKGARTNNLKNIDITIPLSKLICVIGVSGSGKSSLISKTLYPAVLKELGKSFDTPEDYDSIIGTKNISNIYYVGQKAIGRTPRSNPGTYTGVFDLIRDFYGNLEEAKKKKLTKECFSFNSTKGQCEECKGAGQIAVPMYFMSDIYTICSRCNGKRYKEKVLGVKYKGYSISDLLELEIREVKELFKEEDKIFKILDMLDKVGLPYIKLGQSATTLSGGEAQRIKLAKGLCDEKTQDAIYILDEPTTGLHDEDIKKLVYILKELTNNGATVIVIEHNPLLIQQGDWIIEMGPQGGDLGGYVVREGWLQ